MHHAHPALQTFKRQWTNNYGGAAGTPAGRTMQDYHSTCSYNKVTFLPENNLVFGPIPVPCTGTTDQGQTWSASACGGNEIYGWAQYAEKWVVQNHAVNLSYFKRRILMLPDLSQCPWAGLGSVGCGGHCYTWIQVGG